MQKVCRLCLQAEQHDSAPAVPLFSDDVNDNECQLLRLHIANLCSIVILQDDDLPKFICHECKIRLHNAYDFVSLCKRSNDKLHEHYEKNKRCQTAELISLKGKKLKQIKDRRQKCTDKFSRSTEKSLRAYSQISINAETCIPTLCHDTFNGDIEMAKPKSDDDDDDDDDDDNDRTDVNSKTQETTLKEKITLNCSKILPDNSGKQYLCDVCSKTFVSMSGLRFHLKSHNGSKPHTCRYCAKSFVIPSYRKRHEKIHTGDKLYVCHICSTAFASSNGLKYHLRTHTGEANYHCSTCDKSFARYKYLKEHTFTHTGEKPFICKLCGCAYSNSGTLFVHEKKCKSQHTFDFQDTGSCADRNIRTRISS